MGLPRSTRCIALSTGQRDKRTLPKPRQCDRERQIIARAEAGDTLQEIGDSFHITRERVRQILARARQDGIKIQAAQDVRKDRFVCLTMAAERCGGLEMLRGFINEGIVQCRGGGKKGSRGCISREELDKAIARWEQVRPRCQLCGETRQENIYQLCPKCQRTEEGTRICNRATKARRMAGCVANRVGIQKKIAESLKKNPDCRIGLFEAAQISGLSNMQITYARQCGTISSRLTGAGAGYGEAHYYSEGEMRDIAALLDELESENADAEGIEV